MNNPASTRIEGATSRKKCVIIGGGASGALTAIELLKCSSIDVIVVDPNAELGRGRAYSKASNVDLLNVPASRMSADSKKADDFTEWLNANHGSPETFPYWPFVPRSFFGQYLKSKVAAYLGSNLVHIQSRVENISPQGSGYQITLINGLECDADFVVICTGYTGSPAPIMAAKESDGSETRKVLVLGSALSAIDFWRAQGAKPNTHVTFLSRHGLVPLAHSHDPQKIEIPKLSGLSPLEIFHICRHIAKVSKLHWQNLADAIRPQVQFIWSGWNRKERAQFIRHLKCYWEIIRHRIPEKINDELNADLESGKLNIIAGRLQGIGKNTKDLIELTYVLRGSDKLHEAAFHSIFFAMGAKIDQSLAVGKEKIPGLEVCPHGFGYNNEGALNLWVVGPAAKAKFWEITAISEIREQAYGVAREISRAAIKNVNLENCEQLF